MGLFGGKKKKKKMPMKHPKNRNALQKIAKSTKRKSRVREALPADTSKTNRHSKTSKGKGKAAALGKKIFGYADQMTKPKKGQRMLAMSKGGMSKGGMSNNMFGMDTGHTGGQTRRGKTRRSKSHRPMTERSSRVRISDRENDASNRITI